MLIENRVQIEAIKTRDYMGGRAGNTVMITNGNFIVYIPEKACIIDISKIREFPKDGIEKYNADKIEKLIKSIKLTKKALILTKRIVRLFEDEETGEKIWIDDKYLKMFPNVSYHSADVEEKGKVIVCTRYGRIIGLILPVMVSDNESN